jgi:TonB family protein
MKTIFFKITLIIFLFSIHSSFAQTITKKRGKVTTYHPNGERQSSGKVKNYKKQGVWNYYDDQGRLQETTTYKNDVKQGLHIFFYSDDGEKAEEGNYLNGEKSGLWMEWYPGGKILSKVNYSGHGDEIVGLEQIWYENGKLKSQSNYENGKMVYDWQWYENGRPHEMKYYENGLPDGTWKTYLDSSMSDTFPTVIDNYSNGKKNGLHERYFNGKLMEQYYFKDDKLEGSYKFWDSKGKLTTSETYKNGVLDGECNYYGWYDTKTIQYVNGKKNGVEKELDGVGKLSSLSWYHIGILDSTKTFNANGKISTSRTYVYYPGFVHTEEFSFYKEWDENGNLLLSGKYHFEQKDNNWTTYYPSGKEKSVTPYVAGKIKGTYKKWYSNGKEMIEYECEGSSVTSQPKVWDEKGKLIPPLTKAWKEIVDSSLPGEIYYSPPSGNQKHSGKVPEEIKPVYNVGWGDPYPITTSEKPIVDSIYNPVFPRDTNIVFQYAQPMPEFPGGSDSLKLFLAKHVKFPQKEKEEGKSGTVFVGFVVEKDGSLTDIKVLKAVPPDCPDFSNEAIRVVSIMPKWKPGKMNGRTVRVQSQTAVRFIFQ